MEHASIREERVVFQVAEAFEYYGTKRGRVPNYVNEFALMSREHTLPLRPRSFWCACSCARPH